MRAILSIALSALAAVAWAVPVLGAAHLFAPERGVQSQRSSTLFRPARFRVSSDHGLLINTWLNGRGPYVFAIDTGAGLSVISQQIITAAGLTTRTTRPTLIGGLSGTTTTSNRQATIDTMGLGDQNNLLPPGKTAMIVNYLPQGVDGILDPTDAFAPNGYSIDMPKGLIAVLDAAVEANNHPSVEGATVEWLRRGDSDRPFVELGDGRLALLDTGSRFGLAVSDRQAVVVSRNKRPHTVPGLDLGGGVVNARRVAPTTISIGELVLRGIPTDILSGVADDAPIILGRAALYPFKISFDPGRRTIAFATSRR